MTNLTKLTTTVQAFFADQVTLSSALDELTLEVAPTCALAVFKALRDEPAFNFAVLIDLCGIDYSDYGIDEWLTEKATGSGFERGVQRESSTKMPAAGADRFAVVYHLLSIQHNQRIRVRVRAAGEPARVDSVISIWPAADWYEREAFDLFGILFDGHPDLRRILTDYGFIGYPFRKDFPLIGNVEVRYDAAAGRVIYEPVSIPPRTLVPKVIRDVDKTATAPILPPEQQANG